MQELALKHRDLNSARKVEDLRHQRSVFFVFVLKLKLICTIMKVEELIGRTSLRVAGQSVGVDVRMVEGRLECQAIDPDDPRYTMDFVMPTMKMVEACRADDFDFFQPLIDAGKLTAEQMHHAAGRYHLGKTRSGQPIFWMIDEMMDPLDGHVGADGWISTALKRREPLLRYWRPSHCFFGQHLLTDEGRAVCVVESEQSAVVLSELFPESIWMAYVSIAFLSVERFAPLQGHPVTIYPCTDASFTTFPFFEDLAASVRKRYGMHVTVASILEDYATDEQKERGIDILDFIMEQSS